MLLLLFLPFVQQHPPRPQELTCVEKYVACVGEALEAFRLNNMLRTAGKYETALNLWTKSPKVVSVPEGRPGDF